MQTLEIIREPIRGDMVRSKVSLVSKAGEVFDRFVMPKALAESIINGNHHYLYSARIAAAEKKYQEESRKNEQVLQHCTVCHAKLEEKHFTSLERSTKKICDACWEVVNDR